MTEQELDDIRNWCIDQLDKLMREFTYNLPD